MTTTTTGHPETITRSEQMAQFAAAVAGHLPGWTAVTEDGEWHPTARLTHPNLGEIVLRAYSWSRGKVTVYWHLTDETILATLPDRRAFSADANATIATGPAKVASQIKNRIIKRVPDLIEQARAEGARVTEQSTYLAGVVADMRAAAGIAPHRVTGHLVPDAAEFDTPGALPTIEWRTGESTADFEVNPRRPFQETRDARVNVRLRGLTAAQAVRVAAVLNEGD